MSFSRQRSEILSDIPLGYFVLVPSPTAAKEELMPNVDARPGLSRRSLIAGALGMTAATAGGGVLSGCSGSSSAAGSGGGAGSVAPSVTLGPKLPGVQYPDGYVGPVHRELKPLTSEKVTFKVVVKQDVTIGDWKTNAFTKWLEQKTNVH